LDCALEALGSIACIPYLPGMIRRSYLQSIFILAVCSAALAQNASTPSTAPTTVTLKLYSVHPRDAIAEFCKQTGASITVWPENMWDNRGTQLPTSITLDVDQKAFWVALDAICTAAHLQPTQMNNGDAITLQQSGDRAGFANSPQSVSPSATVIVTQIQRNHTVSFSNQNPQPQKTCGLNINVYIDPRLRASRYQARATIEQATDEAGNNISPTADTSSHQPEQELYNKWNINGMCIPLDYDPEISHKLAVLKGSITLTVIAELETLEITDIPNAKGTQKEVAGRKVTIEEATESEKNMSVKMTIERQDVPKEEFRKTGNIFRAVKFLTADGKALSVGGGGGGGDDKLTYTFSTSFSDDANKPAKMVWEVPTRMDSAEIPFEFKDLPLP
jgi:hypothetical protein